MTEVIAGTYELKNKIGSGGGGVVYLAEHLRLGKKVVLKADKRKITTRPEILRREVDALKDLKHTYIPQVYDFFVEDETVYTVIDYVEGESLDKPLKRGEKFSQPQVIKWACELLEALCYLHNPVHGTPPKGIVHSDIKPANIMFKPDGDICLIDFNIALALGEENVVGLSAGYASPEQYGLDFSTDSVFTESSKSDNKTVKSKMTTVDDTAETVVMKNIDETKTIKMTESESGLKYNSSLKKIVVPDARSDIYSLGATLYHLLSGRRPHKNAVEVESLSGDNFSPMIVKIIAKSMNPNPDLRYQTAEEMLYDFTHLRENDPRMKKRKRVCVVISTILIITFFGGTFSSFVGLKRMEMTQKYLTYAEYSQNALADGNVEQAVRYAMEALPTQQNMFTPEYSSEAKKALADALGVYDLSDGFKQYKILELPSEIFKIAISPDGRTGAAVYSFNAIIFDTDTGEIIDTLPVIESALSDIVFIDNNKIVYAGKNGLSVYDTKNKNQIWSGDKATNIAVSYDKNIIAGIYRNEGYATIYDINGNKKNVINFRGKKQNVPNRDTFSDPNNNLISLSKDGSMLAVSFEDGGLTIYNTADTAISKQIIDKSEYNHFEGGFKDKYFAYSAVNDNSCEFTILDTLSNEKTVNFSLDSKVGVKANEDGIYIYNLSTLVNINPKTGKQKEMAYADSDITDFDYSNNEVIVSTINNDVVFFDSYAQKNCIYSCGKNICTFVGIADDYAIVAGGNSPEVKILKRKEYEESQICVYDRDFSHAEARVSPDGNRFLLFDYKSFRLQDKDGNIIKNVEIPDSKKVSDQQYSHKSGNLAVMYNNALIIYSGIDGKVLYEAHNLKYVKYSKFGVHTVDAKGVFRLINIDTVMEENVQNIIGEHGVFCGFMVDDSFLNGGKVTGVGKTLNGYFCAISKGDNCTVYNENAEKIFETSISSENEAFFTDNEIIIAPKHGTPIVYSLKDGSKINELEKDSYITYITQLEDYVMSEYITVNGEHYGILLDKNTYKPLAYMAGLADIYNNQLIFDYNKGNLRKTNIYSINDIINIGIKFNEERN
ncbi:MAG: protein kinase [Clostridiales bacterium]|nr:protein kinase [Clostridiales bacterium]